MAAPTVLPDGHGLPRRSRRSSLGWRRTIETRVIAGFVERGPPILDHYHGERNHQGLGNALIVPIKSTDETAGALQCRERLGGLLKYYYVDAA